MSVSRRYHEETKYSAETIGRSGWDPDRQPEPFKTFHTSARIDLRANLLLARDELSGQPVLTRRGPPERVGLQELSTILLHTTGVTALLQPSTYLRAAPSAGALYPTETYVAALDVAGLQPGIYNYQAKEHALAPVCDGDFRGDLGHLTFGHPALTGASCALLFSAVFLRSVWRYRDRGYRRILLDTGHVIGNLAVFAPELGLHAHVIADFADAGLNSLLLFDPDEEAMLAVVPLIPAPRVSRTSPTGSPHGEGAECESLFLSLHHGSAMTEPGARGAEHADPPRPSPLPLGETACEPLDPASAFDWGDRLTATILRRRSTREFTGAPLQKEELASLLEYSYRPTREDGSDADGAESLIAPGLLRTLLAVHNVTGLARGLYVYDPEDGVSLLRTGDFRSRCGDIALGQALAASAAAVVFHTADLDAVVTHYGDRGYRYLGLDAGHIGERMNLAAIRLGLGASGIGGYYDDLINDLFGLAPDEIVVYMTCIGQPPVEL